MFAKRIFRGVVSLQNTYFLMVHHQEQMVVSQRPFSLIQMVELLGIEMALELVFVELVELLVGDLVTLAAERMVLVVRRVLADLDKH